MSADDKIHIVHTSAEKFERISQESGLIQYVDDLPGKMPVPTRAMPTPEKRLQCCHTTVVIHCDDCPYVPVDRCRCGTCSDMRTQVPEENMPVPPLKKYPHITKPREFLLFCSYCGDDNEEGCTDARPCNDCLAMSNIFDESGKYVREMGPPVSSQKILDRLAYTQEDVTDLMADMAELVDDKEQLLALIGWIENVDPKVVEDARAVVGMSEPVPSRLMPVARTAHEKEQAMTPEQIKHMVDRFLQWKLPADFRPDNGISFEKIGGAGILWEGKSMEYTREPVGTNLLTAAQAETMVRHMLEGLPNG